MSEVGKSKTETTVLSVRNCNHFQRVSGSTTPFHKENLNILHKDEAIELTEVAEVVSTVTEPGCLIPEAIKLQKSNSGTQADKLRQIRAYSCNH